MRTAVVALLAALAAGAAVAFTGSNAAAVSAAGRVIDRTLTCSVTLRGGAYILEARAHSGTRLQKKWAKLPYVGLRTGVFARTATNLLAWMTAGAPTATTTIDNEFNTFEVKTFGTLGLRRELCRQTTAPVPLTVAGLSGGVADRLGDEFECFTPPQVIVRVRAMLAAPGALRRGEDFEVTHLPIREAKLAARTPKGKPLVYADVVESGKARLFVATGCIQR